MNDITIVAAADEKYAMFFCAMAASVLAHAASQDNYCFKLLTDGFSKETEHNIKQLRNIRECRIDIVSVDLQQFNKVPTLKHLSAMTNARLKLPSIFPELSKVIYLDCDIIVNTNIANLWNIDLNGFPIAAALDYAAGRQEFAALGFDLKKYFNAGVIVMDLAMLRKMEFERSLVEVLIQQQSLRHDQDILNFIFKNQWLQLLPEWNSPPELYPPLLRQYNLSCRYSFKRALRHPAIIHYNGMKPTRCRFRGRYRRKFWKYLRMTEYRDYKTPDLSLYNYIWRITPNPLLRLGSKIKKIVIHIAKKH